MKFDEVPQAAPLRAVGSSDPADGGTVDAGTRHRITHIVGEHGPISATDIAAHLNISGAAVRRHLEAMAAEGVLDTVELVGDGKRRGRPAKRYVLTEHGGEHVATAYDSLSVSLLRYLEQHHGRQAVESFAKHRAAELVTAVQPALVDAELDTLGRVQALAEALNRNGFAASARPVSHPAAMGAVQLCQGSCPIRQVATEFPELCTAETQAFSEVLGLPVRRLATMAHGGHACTTHISLVNTTENRAAHAAATQTEPVSPSRDSGKGRS